MHKTGLVASVGSVPSPAVMFAPNVPNVMVGSLKSMGKVWEDKLYVERSNAKSIAKPLDKDFIQIEFWF